jgi:hypothetical protein
VITQESACRHSWQTLELDRSLRARDRALCAARLRRELRMNLVTVNFA